MADSFAITASYYKAPSALCLKSNWCKSWPGKTHRLWSDGSHGAEQSRLWQCMGQPSCLWGPCGLGPRDDKSGQKREESSQFMGTPVAGTRDAGAEEQAEWEESGGCCSLGEPNTGLTVLLQVSQGPSRSVLRFSFS